MTHVDGSAGVQVVRSSQLSGVVGTVHGFSTRHGGTSRVYRPGLPEGDGDLNLGYTAQDDAACVRENRLRFLHALPGQGLRGFMLLKQTHTPNVRIVESVADAAEDFAAPATQEGDGLMTDVPGVLLAVGCCGLYSGAGRRPGAARGGGIPCRLERHSGTHRGARHRCDDAPVPIQSIGSACSRWTGNRPPKATSSAKSCGHTLQPNSRTRRTCSTRCAAREKTLHSTWICGRQIVDS